MKQHEHYDSLLKRFMKFVTKLPNDGCWIWTGTRNKQGYGGFRIKNKMKRSHRVSYSIFVGLLQDELDVLHKCDNPSCVNPDHLFAGTDKDNVKDAISKGRHINPMPKQKLTESQVFEIRNKYIPFEYPIRKLAREYKVSYWTIQSILNGKNWSSHVGAR